MRIKGPQPGCGCITLSLVFVTSEEDVCEQSGFYPPAVMEMPFFFSFLSLSYHYIVIYIVDDKTKSDDDSMEVES